jgi:hypothetical protein
MEPDNEVIATRNLRKGAVSAPCIKQTLENQKIEMHPSKKTLLQLPIIPIAPFSSIR